MNLRQAIASLMFGLGATSAGAADLVLSGYRIPLAGASPVVSADLRSANVVVNTVANQGIKGDGWCPPSAVGTRAAPPPYVELRMPSQATHRISINGAGTRLMPNGDVVVTAVQPGGLQGDGWCPPDITWPVPLTANPNTVQAGQGLQLSWTSAGAQSCAAGASTYPQGVSSVDNWTGALPTQSAGRVVAPLVPGSYTFQIVCTSPTGAVFSQSAAVTVTPAPVDPCLAHPPPAGLVRATSFLNTSGLHAGANREWAIGAVLDLTLWDPPKPGQVTLQGINRSVIGHFARQTGDTATISMASNGYLAMRIETDGIVNAAGTLITEQPGQNAAPHVISISPCPGDFAPADPKCLSQYGGANSLGWTFTGAPASFCRLTAGTDYYLNMMWLHPTQMTNGCVFGQCWWLVAQSCAQGCRPD